MGFVGLVEDGLHLLLGGGFFLLHQVGAALGDAPAVRGGHGGAEGAARRRPQVLPVLATSPARKEELLFCSG